MQHPCAYVNGREPCMKWTTLSYPFCSDHLRSECNLEIKTSTIPGAGLGLFYVGDKTVPAKTIITQYSGYRVTVQPNFDSIYLYEFSHDKFLDSEPLDNYPGRYINDAQNTPFKNNVDWSGSARPMFKYNRQCVNIYTKCEIQPGEELFISYGEAYWNSREIIQPI